MQILGYLTLYMKFVSKDSIYYAKSEQDFRKPITEEVLQLLLQGVKELYEKAFQQTIIDASFISKEEYESQDNEQLQTEVFHNGEECTITNSEMLKSPETWTYELIGKAYPDGPERTLLATKSENQFMEQMTQSITIPEELKAYPETKLYCIRFRYENGTRIHECFDHASHTWKPIPSPISH